MSRQTQTDTNTATIYRNGAPCGDRPSVDTACISLPLSYIELDAKQLKDEIKAIYSTPSRFNCDLAIVQVSRDASNFSDLRYHSYDTPNSKKREEVRYSFPVDEIEDLTGKKILKETIYFRIKSSYLDGSNGYSPMVSLLLTGSENTMKASVSPNPVRLGDFVRIESNTSGTYSVEILDLTGKTLIKHLNISDKDPIILDLQPALYFVKLRYPAGEIQLLPIIVQ